ncbi:MAG: hypothetical protein V1911_03405, partial [Candidatus Micrarchaeota archaeon]
MDEEIDKLRKSQQDLRKQIDGLEKSAQNKKMFEGYDKQRELEDMVKVALRQNKKLADKVDYLMDALIEASEEQGDEEIEGTLKSLAKSQIQIMEEIDYLKKQLKDQESFGKISSDQKDSISETQKKMSELQATLEKMPHDAQISSLKQEVNDLEHEIQTMEALVTTTAPEEITNSLNLIRNDMDQLNGSISKLAVKVEKIGKDEENIEKTLSSKTNIDTLQLKLGSLESKLDAVSHLISTGKIARETDIKGKISEIEEDAAGLEKIRKHIDLASSLDAAEKEKMVDVMKELSEIEAEVRKISEWTKRYPISDMQKFNYMKEKFARIEESITSFKRQSTRALLVQQMADVREMIHELEDRLASEGADIGGRNEKQLATIIALLDSIDRKVSVVEKDGEMEKLLSDLHKNCNELGGKMSGRGAEKHIDKISEKTDEIARRSGEESISESGPAQIVKSNIGEARKTLKGADAGGADTERIKELK